MYTIKPYAKPITPFAWWEGAFSDQELDWLQEKAKTAYSTAEVGTDNGQCVEEKIRRTKVVWLSSTPENDWVFERLAHVVSSLNVDYFDFNLDNFENLQLTNYLAADQGTYGWHQDFGNELFNRKLSLVLQLSDPSEYEGGELQLLIKKDPLIMPKKRGHITVFPAWALHQVTPVVKGTRQTLVAWASGEPFK